MIRYAIKSVASPKAGVRYCTQAKGLTVCIARGKCGELPASQTSPRVAFIEVTATEQLFPHLFRCAEVATALMCAIVLHWAFPPVATGMMRLEVALANCPMSPRRRSIFPNS